MNIGVLAGVMQRDADYRMTNNGLSVAKFTIRVPGTVKDKDGRYQSTFINCVAFGKTADNVANYVHDKDTFVVRYHLDVNKWTDKEGNKRSDISVVVDNIDFPPKKSQPSAFDSMGEEDIAF